MLDLTHFRLYIVRDALKAAGWWSQEIENLIVGTAMVESNIQMLVQMGGGPARGLFQIEKRSFEDVVGYIKRDSQKIKAICGACGFSVLPEDVDHVIWNLRFAVLITRMFYYRIPEALPNSDDYKEMSNYHKKYYNTVYGKTDVSKSIEIFKKVCSYKD